LFTLSAEDKDQELRKAGVFISLEEEFLMANLTVYCNTLKAFTKENSPFAELDDRCRIKSVCSKS
jgi:hypothetical protein